MTGPLQRIRRRAARDPQDAPAQASTDQPAADQATAAQPSVPPPDAPGGAPAGTEAPAARPGFRERGRLRRRLRFLRRARELGLRDLGGLVFEQHKQGRPDEDLVRAKVDALRAVDHELRGLERALTDERPITELHEPGVAACERCGALHGSEARYCPNCGLALGGPRTLGGLGAAGSIAPPATATAGPASELAERMASYGAAKEGEPAAAPSGTAPAEPEPVVTQPAEREAAQAQGPDERPGPAETPAPTQRPAPTEREDQPEQRAARAEP